jgi:hypothetical protein
MTGRLFDGELVALILALKRQSGRWPETFAWSRLTCLRIVIPLQLII